MLRRCFREPIPEIEVVAFRLAAAALAHLTGDHDAARTNLRLADCDVVRTWLDSVWGKASIYTQFRAVPDAPPVWPKAERRLPRYATPETRKRIHQRDGFYCRCCKIPVVRAEVRQFFVQAYPDAVAWAGTTRTQHSAFQCLWAQYDHVVPHARGGSSDFENMVLTCAACNYGRMSYTLEEVGMAHPDTHPPRLGPWDGLEGVLLQRMR